MSVSYVSAEMMISTWKTEILHLKKWDQNKENSLLLKEK